MELAKIIFLGFTVQIYLICMYWYFIKIHGHPGPWVAAAKENLKTSHMKPLIRIQNDTAEIFTK